MSNNSYIIKDLDYFVNYSRLLVFENYGKNDESNQKTNGSDLIDYAIENLSESDKKELEQILSYEESLTIVKSVIKTQTHKITKEKRYIITDKSYMEILQSMGDRMTSNILHGLVNRGIVDTAYDSNLDDFVFWVKDNNK